MPEPNLTRLPCKLCGAELHRDDKSLCRVCMGLQTGQLAEKPEEELVKKQRPFRRPLVHKCLKCGEEDPNKFYSTSKSECKKCANQRSRAYKRAKREQRNNPPAKRTWTIPEATVTNNHTITLDFEPYPWVLKWLRDQYDDVAMTIIQEIARIIPAEWHRTDRMEEVGL